MSRYLVTPIGRPTKFKTITSRPRLQSRTIGCIGSLLFSGIRSGVFLCLGLSMRFAELELSVKYLRSSAGLGGRLERPSPCRVRAAPRRELRRMPSETSKKLQKHRKTRRNSEGFGCIFTPCSACMIYKFVIILNGSELLL